MKTWSSIVQCWFRNGGNWHAITISILNVLWRSKYTYSVFYNYLKWKIKCNCRRNLLQYSFHSFSLSFQFLFLSIFSIIIIANGTHFLKDAEVAKDNIGWWCFCVSLLCDHLVPPRFRFWASGSCITWIVEFRLHVVFSDIMF